MVCTPFDRTGSLVALSAERRRTSSLNAAERIVVLEPCRQQHDNGCGFRQNRQSSIIERTGVKHRLRPKAMAVSSVFLTMQAEPSWDNHSTTCGVLLMPNRRSTQATIRSREMPAVVADQAISPDRSRRRQTTRGRSRRCGWQARSDRRTREHSRAGRSRCRRACAPAAAQCVAPTFLGD
jgi:hypothetical protein